MGDRQMRPMGADRTVRVGNSEDVIDVVPVGQDQWLARCECGETQRFPSAEAGWEWVLSHPCDEAAPTTVDLTEPTRTCTHGGGSGI